MARNFPENKFHITAFLCSVYSYELIIPLKGEESSKLEFICVYLSIQWLSMPVKFIQVTMELVTVMQDILLYNLSAPLYSPVPLREFIFLYQSS